MEQQFKELNISELSSQMINEAVKLGTGKILCAYRDGTSVRLETENGENPYVWRDGRWREMQLV